MKLQFLGAAGQVTGSRYLLEADGARLLVDCGLFQEREFIGRNWEPSPVPPDSIDYVLLTHAHLDHSGLIPRLVANGYDKPILTSPASRELAEIILTDAARIQEEDARQKRKRHESQGRTGPHKDEPLYTAEDVKQALPLFRDVGYGEPVELNGHVTVTFRDAGHILGSAMLEIAVRSGGRSHTIVFSGDIGQWDKPILRDPSLLSRADYLVMESTYGDRNHESSGAVDDQLCAIINETVDAGGNILIPTFAVERAQEIMYHLAELLRQDRIPNLLAFLDSPMAVDVTDVFRRHREYMDAEALAILDRGESLFRFPGLKFVKSSSESKGINRIRGSCVIMAGSGMCTAGRIKHHLIRNIERPECAIMIVGYQAQGTLGRQLVDGEPEVRILGTRYKVKARVREVHGLSAHADQAALLKWAGHFTSPPKRAFLTHGEPRAAEVLAERLRKQSGWTVDIPRYREEVELTGG